jgi:hypothetical protein
MMKNVEENGAVAVSARGASPDRHHNEHAPELRHL